MKLAVHSHVSFTLQVSILLLKHITDLDSVVSAIAYSWLETEVHKRKTIALIRFNQADLPLRKENIHALTLAGLKTDARELLYLNDIPKSEIFPSNKFALVDHNRVESSFITDNPTAQVVAVVDHHQDEGLYKDTAQPRIITPSGSCASLIARMCPRDIPRELATLLLCAILVDTRGLKTGGTAVQADREAAAFLAPLSTLSSSFTSHMSGVEALHDDPAIMRLTAELNVMKADLSHLSAWDLLRRDYKEYTISLPWADPRISIKAGLSTVPFSLEYLLTEGRLEIQLQPWMTSRGLSVLGILTSYTHIIPGRKGKHKREQLWVVRDAELMKIVPGDDPDQPRTIDTDLLSKRLSSGMKASAELGLKRQERFDIDMQGKLPAGMKVRVYDQKNTGASRKVIAPTLKKVLGSSGPLPQVVTIKEH